MNTRRGTGIGVLSRRAITLKVMLVLMGAVCSAMLLCLLRQPRRNGAKMPLTLREATAFALQSNLEIQIAA